VKQRSLAATLAGDYDLVGGAQGLAAEAGIDGALVGYAELEIVLDKRVENGIGYLIANLIRMALPPRFAGEKIIVAAQSEVLPSKGMGRAGLRAGFCTGLCQQARRRYARGQLVGRVVAASTDAVKMWAKSGRPPWFARGARRAFGVFSACRGWQSARPGRRC